MTLKRSSSIKWNMTHFSHQANIRVHCNEEADSISDVGLWPAFQPARSHFSLCPAGGWADKRPSSAQAESPTKEAVPGSSPTPSSQESQVSLALSALSSHFQTCLGGCLALLRKPPSVSNKPFQRRTLSIIYPSSPRGLESYLKRPPQKQQLKLRSRHNL